MDWMIAFIMQIAVSVCRLTAYGSANGVVANFYQHIQKRQCSRSFICESNIRVSVGGIVKKFFEFVYAMCPYHEDVINVSLINSRLKWNGR